MLNTFIVQPNTHGITLTAAMQPEYAAFVGAFGGWTAAQAVLASRHLAREDEQPIALTIDFQQGISPGDVMAQASVVKQTKSTQFMSVKTLQDETLRASSTIIWSRRRDTENLDCAAFPVVPDPLTLQPDALPPTPNTWINQFDMRHAHGKPLTRSEHMHSLVWTRYRDNLPLTAHRLAAFADASLPRIFYHYNALSPISTVTMSVYFHATAEDLAQVGNDFVLIDASASAARAGFYDQQLRIWSRAGVLLATSAQLVWFNVQSAAA